MSINDRRFIGKHLSFNQQLARDIEKQPLYWPGRPLIKVGFFFSVKFIIEGSWQIKKKMFIIKD